VTPVPLTLPLRLSEAAEVANLVFDLAERRPLTDEIRNRIAARIVPLKLESLTPYMGSLARDPVHHSTYYLAVDVAEGPPQLLHMALATAPTSSVFHKPLLLGRVRRAGGPEAVLNAIPFSPADGATLEKYVGKVDSALLPRPLGSRGALVAAPARSGTAIAAAFEAFRRILKRTGRNLAAIEMAAPDYDAGLFAAVRAGWRDGYAAGVTLRAAEASREAIRDAARFTRFRIDAAGLVVDDATADSAPEERFDERFEAAFTAEERGWIFDEFVRSIDVGGSAYELTAAETTRMAVRLGPALKACERLHEWIREARSVIKAGRSFDFELALPAASAKELVFCLHWLRAREHAAQSVAPGAIAIVDTELEPALREFAAIARHYGCLLTVDSGVGHTDAALEAIARSTAGRLNYRVCGGSAEAAEYTQELNRIAEVLWG
jgi:hypothetical protein